MHLGGFPAGAGGVFQEHRSLRKRVNPEGGGSPIMITILYLAGRVMTMNGNEVPQGFGTLCLLIFS